MRLALYVVAVVASFLHVERASAAGDKSNGCGVGWYVADKMTLISSTTRQVTHAFAPPTFSMTSGTSGCAPHSIVLQERRSEHFVEANYDRLREEAARGEGEFLHAFLDTMACQPSARSAASGLIQKNFEGVFADDLQPSAVVERARALMRLSMPSTGSCASA